MADIRIKDLATLESASLTGDVFVIDGTTGTRKLSAFSPTFGGNVVVTGTLTSQSTLSTSAGLSCQNADITGGYITLRGFGTQDGGLIFLGQAANNNYINSSATAISTAIANTAVVRAQAEGWRVLTTTASTTTTTGALVVGNGTSGGLGVGGNITLGGGVNIAGAASDPLPAGTSGIWTLSGSGLRINSAGVTFASLTGTTLGTATLTVNGTTSSTTTSTGALVVSGGLGVGGAVNAGTFYGLVDGVTAPATESGYARIYVDSADGDLKVKFGDGTVKTIATDS